MMGMTPRSHKAATEGKSVYIGRAESWFYWLSTWSLQQWDTSSQGMTLIAVQQKTKHRCVTQVKWVPAKPTSLSTFSRVSSCDQPFSAPCVLSPPPGISHLGGLRDRLCWLTSSSASGRHSPVVVPQSLIQWKPIFSHFRLGVGFSSKSWTVLTP